MFTNSGRTTMKLLALIFSAVLLVGCSSGNKTEGTTTDDLNDELDSLVEDLGADPDDFDFGGDDDLSVEDMFNKGHTGGDGNGPPTGERVIDELSGTGPLDFDEERQVGETPNLNLYGACEGADTVIVGNQSGGGWMLIKCEGIDNYVSKQEFKFQEDPPDVRWHIETDPGVKWSVIWSAR